MVWLMQSKNKNTEMSVTGPYEVESIKTATTKAGFIHSDTVSTHIKTLSRNFFKKPGAFF